MRLLRLISMILVLVLTEGVDMCHAKDFVVVIDPGHGGKDAGACGIKTNEKSINLNVAKKLRKMLLDEMDDVRVEMTRDDDRFITLQNRADFANHKHADIFISIHANSVSKKNRSFSTINGSAVYTLGLDRSDTNLAVAMRENEVMKLEQDYSTTYQGFDPSSTESYIAFEMMQHKNMDQSIALAEEVQNQLVHYAGRKNNGVRQAPFWVLVRSSMPSILVELDFICNPEMESFMASDKGSTRLARAIFNGVARYRKTSSGGGVSAGKSEGKGKKAKIKDSEGATDNGGGSEASASAAPDNSQAQNDDIVYRIQFLVTPRPLPSGDKRFKGLNPESYRDGGSVKYTVGRYSSSREAARELPEIKKKFPDAFIIKTRNGQRIK